MKLVRYEQWREEPARFGIFRGQSVIPVEGDLFGDLRESEGGIPLSLVTLLAPIQPVNLLCLGKNFRSFPGEQSDKFPREPLLFLKATSAVIGPDAPIRLPVTAPDQVYFEAELAVVIGKTARNVRSEDALRHVLGYTVCNDLGAKDCQAKDGQWARAKSFDGFAPLGPWIETDLNPANCRIQSRLNGKPVQDSTTELMLFNVAETISFVSSCMTLLPGTVISMGSPGVLEEPRPFLRPGDVVEAEVEGIATLRNVVKAEGED